MGDSRDSTAISRPSDVLSQPYIISNSISNFGVMSFSTTVLKKPFNNPGVWAGKSRFETEILTCLSYSFFSNGGGILVNHGRGWGQCESEHRTSTEQAQNREQNREQKQKHEQKHEQKHSPCQHALPIGNQKAPPRLLLISRRLPANKGSICRSALCCRLLVQTNVVPP